MSGVYLTKIEDEEKEEEIPIALENPNVAKPFELLTNIFALPKYKELDPTLFIFLIFPIFFGMMLGDIGYGLICLGAFLLLKGKLKSEGWQSLLNILIYSSLVTIFFGFLYGEFFGFEEIGGYKLPHVLSRMHAIPQLLLITVGIGAFHVNFGLALGFYNEFKRHGVIRAMQEKGSWILLQIGVGLLALAYLKMLTIPTFLGGLIALLSLGLLISSEGFIAIFEIPTLMSNLLSYTRLAAIGLSSVCIAYTINNFASMFLKLGGAYLILMVLCLIFGHIGNTILGVFAPFLQALRLHYVEFFTKFYEGGGIKYDPFGYKRTYTEV
jgi:V/A-type H+-transporting ATPase subunit I